ncbi:autotransporter outer membrane beta-barrel domain-containing protein [Limnohabitans sp. Rim8]|uniref:autotransporter outer membrane beta-barrel domain-containing protein n=1 Tax=Limnohabitans sp. Rim8 TaxID=1100718 RepID=UPI0025D6D6C2|nr:autotransporter outer membrane beta-barrel domain-containing protein [Limnohabitans sp. Rim8]
MSVNAKQSNMFSISTRVLIHLFQSFIVVFSVFFSININAAACASNTNVTVDCEDLVLNGAGVVTVDAGVTVTGTAGVTATINAGASNALVNAGIIKGNGSDGFINNASLDTLRNTGTIRSFGFGGQIGIINNSIISNFFNSGWIGGLNQGLSNTGTITSLLNASGGSIGAVGSGLNNGGNIETLTNIGTISSAFGFDLSNSGVIGTLNNLNNGVVLRFNGTLPENYDIIINSPASFGRLDVTNNTGNTIFGISSLSSGKSAVSTTPYSAVLSGVTRTQLGINGASLSSISNGYSYTLTEVESVNHVWDLLVSSYYIAPSVANTNQSLVNTLSVLQGTYTLQNSVLANGFSNDCNVFGASNICVSAGGRNTSVQTANGLSNTSALLIAAYRLNQNFRIGAYADQNLSVSNPGGTVNSGNNTPVIGLFGAWNQRLDGTGAEVKVSAAYGQKNTTITRSVVGSGDGASEAGSGTSTLNSQGAQIKAKYGFGLMDKVIVSPYVGVRYTHNNMGGYTEATSSNVTAPLTYSALNINATTLLAGARATYRVIPQAIFFASAGVETDTHARSGTYSVTGISGLAPINFNLNPVRTRPYATLGAYYDLEKNQRFGVTAIYRQEQYQAVSTKTLKLTYSVGL